MGSKVILEAKKAEVEDIGKVFSSNGVYVFDYRGLDVKKFEELRNKVKDLDSNIKVIKNRLIIKHFEKNNLEYGRDLFNGPTAVAYGNEKFVEVAKALVDFQKEHKSVDIKFGFIEGNFADVQEVKTVATLPSKEQLLASFVLTASMPIKKWGMAMSSPLRNLLILMKNLKEKKAKEGEE